MGRHGESESMGGENSAEAIKVLKADSEKITARIVILEGQHVATQKAVQRLRDAFPVGDTEGHRRYHEAMIERNAEIRRLRVAITEKTLSAIIWGVIAFLVIASLEKARKYFMGG